jgi:hypothetical protein
MPHLENVTKTKAAPGYEYGLPVQAADEGADRLTAANSLADILL